MVKIITGMSYKIPIIVFIVISVIMYFVSDTKEKDSNFIIKKSIAPGMVAAIIVTIYIKYKDRFTQNEKLMPGNYFD
jgi:hypothetical protein